jgi:hypothetical protein
VYHLQSGDINIIQFIDKGMMYNIFLIYNYTYMLRSIVKFCVTTSFKNYE